MLLAQPAVGDHIQLVVTAVKHHAMVSNHVHCVLSPARSAVTIPSVAGFAMSLACLARKIALGLVRILESATCHVLHPAVFCPVPNDVHCF